MIRQPAGVTGHIICDSAYRIVDPARCGPRNNVEISRSRSKLDRHLGSQRTSIVIWSTLLHFGVCYDPRWLTGIGTHMTDSSVGCAIPWTSFPILLAQLLTLSRRWRGWRWPQWRRKWWWQRFVQSCCFLRTGYNADLDSRRWRGQWGWQYATTTTACHWRHTDNQLDGGGGKGDGGNNGGGGLSSLELLPHKGIS